MRSVLWLAAGLILASAPCAAQNGIADPARGRELAQRLCSNCHVIAPGGSGAPRLDVPSFTAIANTPAVTPEHLAGAIVIPHPEMPDTSLTRDEIRDVIAYIMSLRESR